MAWSVLTFRPKAADDRAVIRCHADNPLIDGAGMDDSFTLNVVREYPVIDHLAKDEMKVRLPAQPSPRPHPRPRPGTTVVDLAEQGRVEQSFCVLGGEFEVTRKTPETLKMLRKMFSPPKYVQPDTFRWVHAMYCRLPSRPQYLSTSTCDAL